MLVTVFISILAQIRKTFGRFSRAIASIAVA